MDCMLSFAMEQYKDEDPLLSDCAKELIRYITGIDENESVVVTGLDGDTFTVNHNIFVDISPYGDEQGRMIQTTLHTPIDQWKRDDSQRFLLHLVEDSIVDTNRFFAGLDFLCGGSDGQQVLMPTLTFGR